jgi:hypothetical protein
VQSYTFTKKNQLIIRKNHKGLKSALLFIAVLAVFTIFVQLYVMSLFATEGSNITALQQKKEALIKENKSLQHEIAVARNLEYIKKKSENVGYVDIDMKKDVRYITVE